MVVHVNPREVSIVRTLLFISLFCAMTAASAEIFRWTDANGKEVYGDEPPENARSVQEVDLPVLTVAERFKGNPKPNEQQAPAATEPMAEAVANTNSATAKPKPSDTESLTTGYEKFSILVPGTEEVVRSNAGELKVKIDLQPALKPSHGIVVYVDGRQVGETTNDSVDLTGIERGEHSVFAVLHDAQDAILGNTEAVNFTVVRNSLASRARANSSHSSAKNSSANSDETGTLSNSGF